MQNAQMGFVAFVRFTVKTYAKCFGLTQRRNVAKTQSHFDCQKIFGPNDLRILKSLCDFEPSRLCVEKFSLRKSKRFQTKS